MSLPFTPEQFAQTFRLYNESVWPAQLALILIGLGAVIAVLRGGERHGRYVAGALALLWLWTGVAYHLTFFTAINPAAFLFAALCLAQVALFVQAGIVTERLTFRKPRGRDGLLGALLIGYALVLYPLLGYALGHRYPASPTFGVPCPTTIFTFGLLLWAARPAPRVLLVVPTLWAMIATVAAAQLGMVEDFGLPVAALLAVALQALLATAPRAEVAAR